MSENLDLVRSIYSNWERGDDGSTEWAQAEIEWVRADGPEPGTWKGVSEMTTAWRDFLDEWEELHSSAEQYRELDAERILVFDSFSGRGKTSGLQFGNVQTPGVLVFHLPEGEVVKLVAYWDRDRAFADLGLSPEAHDDIR